MSRYARARDWTAFWLLGLVWGSSFFWIKIALRETGPFAVTAFRLLFGLVGLLVVTCAARQPLPREPRLLALYAAVGILNLALPFALISWGETRVDSALAAILIGATPLFTIVIAHLWLHGERLTASRLLGLLTGLAGVMVLVSRDPGPEQLHSGVGGRVALLGAAVSYAVGTSVTRKHLRGRPLLEQVTMVVLAATVLAWAVAPAIEPPLRLPHAPSTWIALVWLGLLASCLAYLVYFHLIRAWDATRASTVSLVTPAVGLVLGVIVLGEGVGWRLVAGSGLVLGGVALTHVRR